MDCIWEVGKTYRTSVQGVTARIRKSNYLYVYGTLGFEPENFPMRKWCARTGYSAEWGGENGLVYPRIQLMRGRGCEVDGGESGGINGGCGAVASGEWGSASDTQEKLLKLVAQLEKELAAKNEVRKVVNDGGTETWIGLKVVVPVGLVPDGETPVEVRSKILNFPTRWIDEYGHVALVRHTSPGLCGSLRILIADAPKPTPITWTPPASLPDGEYEWSSTHMTHRGDVWWEIDHRFVRSMFGAGWTDPSKPGRYRKTGNVATWIGE